MAASKRLKKDVVSKFKLSDTDTKEFLVGDKCVIGKRIVALRDIPSIGVTAGSYYGYLEDEHNLDQDSKAFVFSGLVFGNGRVEGDSLVYGPNSRVEGLVTKKSSVTDSVVGSGCKVHNSILKDSDVLCNSALYTCRMTNSSVYQSSLNLVDGINDDFVGRNSFEEQNSVFETGQTDLKQDDGRTHAQKLRDAVERSHRRDIDTSYIDMGIDDDDSYGYE